MKSFIRSGNIKKIMREKEKRNKVNSPKTRKSIRAVQMFVISLFFVAVAVSIAIIGCNYVSNRNFKETFYSVSSLKVNNKIRVIQISDLHSCTFGKDNKKLIDRVEKLNPDIIVYTGDCLDSKAKTTDRVVNLCKALSEVAPSFYIYGNNETEKYYKNVMTQDSLDEMLGFKNDNREPGKLLEIKDDFTKELEEVGVKVLKNKKETVTIGSTNVDVYGVLTSNPSAFWSYGGESFEDYIYTEENNLKLTAIHEPVVFEEFSYESWGDLILAGHTHGGTVKIPILGPLYVHEEGLFPERKGHYVYGRYDVEGRPLVVSSGLDNKNLLRINNKPEIAIIDINRF